MPGDVTSTFPLPFPANETEKDRLTAKLTVTVREFCRVTWQFHPLTLSHPLQPW